MSAADFPTLRVLGAGSDEALAQDIRSKAAFLAQAIQAAKQAGLEATVTFQVKDAISAPRTIGTQAKAEIMVSPVVTVRRVEVTEL